MCKLPKLLLATIVCITTLSERGLANEGSTIEMTTEGGDYGYKFKDESLLGSMLASGGDIYRSRKGFQRVLLVRPRTNLIAELIKSAEQL
jgi:hypothetical protein